jgi:hypothetical protein
VQCKNSFFYSAFILTVKQIKQPLVVKFGIINVTSNVSEAKIIFNGVDTGKLTPDTIKAEVGTHSIKLVKTDYDTLSVMVSVQKNIQTEASLNLFASNKIVLIEDFANVSCVPCVTSNKILEQLTNNTFGRKKLVAVKFPKLPS